jgi:hypothetical protein
METEPHDLPPHFGTWYRAPQGNHVAYAAFLPNWLHSAYGVGCSMAVWAAHRSQFDSAMWGLIVESTIEGKAAMPRQPSASRWACRDAGPACPIAGLVTA